MATISACPGASTLVVLLPGATMTVDDMVAAGLLEALAAHETRPDVVLVDRDVAALSGEHPLAGVAEEILRPARARYEHLWLGGISLGGFWSIWQLAVEPGLADGLCLLAPYPGTRLTLNEIARAGGLAQWQPTPAQLDDPEYRVWHWLQAPPAGLPVFLGYGREDRFAPGMAEMAAALPAVSPVIVEGGHDWPAWLPLWHHFLTRLSSSS